MAEQAAQEQLLDVRVAEASAAYKFYLNQERKILGTISVVIFLTIWELVGNTLQLINPMFMSAPSLVAKAAVQLFASGETVRRRGDENRGVLTRQESQIAQLARDGLSNPEIGAELYISRHTVEWHMRKVFVKLDIHSRMQLSQIPLTRLESADRRQSRSDPTSSQM